MGNSGTKYKRNYMHEEIDSISKQLTLSKNNRPLTIANCTMPRSAYFDGPTHKNRVFKNAITILWTKKSKTYFFDLKNLKVATNFINTAMFAKILPSRQQTTISGKQKTRRIKNKKTLRMSGT